MEIKELGCSWFVLWLVPGCSGLFRVLQTTDKQYLNKEKNTTQK